MWSVTLESNIRNYVNFLTHETKIATEAPPVQVNITNGQFFLNGQLFTVKGIGYSPTPAGEQIQVNSQSI